MLGANYAQYNSHGSNICRTNFCGPCVDLLNCHLWIYITGGRRSPAVEERFFVSSREFCPAHRRGHWRFAVWAHCVSVFARACSVLLFTCLHTYTSYKWSAWAMFNMVKAETTRCRYTHFVPRTLMKLYQFREKVLVLHLVPGVWGF